MVFPKIDLTKVEPMVLVNHETQLEHLENHDYIRSPHEIGALKES